MFIRPGTNYIILLAFLGLMGLPSCWGWEEPQPEGGRATHEEEVKKAFSTTEEGERAPRSQEEQWQGYSRRREDMDSQQTEDYKELKDVMASASRHMKRLESALGGGNWATVRDSAKGLEDLIGRRCVNSYVKAHREVPQDFVQMSQRFNDAVLRLLVAERQQDATLARSQFQLMQEGCEICHQKYRKERPASGG